MNNKDQGMLTECEQRVKKLFDYYRHHGDNTYIGEQVTQLEHATQCAMQAQEDGQPDSVILGAFLHDIGHIIERDDINHMYTEGVQLGVTNHEQKGRMFLTDLGMPSPIPDIAQGHVDAKRYLCLKNEQYFNALSSASKMTLEHQGGSMTKEEALKFESNPHFQIIIKARMWDENAKEKNITMPPLSVYEEMLTKLLLSSITE